jgi:hypothetical protein
MSAQMLPDRKWLHWFPAADPTHPGWWRLIRFAGVDTAGTPVGKPIVSNTPNNRPRQFRTERSAEWAARELNAQDGL